MVWQNISPPFKADMRGSVYIINKSLKEIRDQKSDFAIPSQIFI